MAMLKWDETGKRLYENGTSHGVLYPVDAKGGYGTGVAWNGLISVKQAPDGAEESPIYANNHKYVSMTSAENFKGTIDAYTYPDEFMECDGSKEISAGVYAGQQTRKPFGLVYSTNVGNDTVGDDYGEKIHLIYQAKVAPSSRDYETINDDPNAITFSWEFSTVPEAVGDDLEAKGIKPTAYICVDTTKASKEAVKKLKDKLYGGEGEPQLPKIEEVLSIIGPNAPQQ